MNDTRGLWRGERLDNREWITGLLAYRSCGIDDLSATEIYNEEDYESYWVDPSTLGECTGLTDKNGNLIFEGDIIKTKKYGKAVGHCNVNNYDVFVVKYEPAVFKLENHNRAFNLVDDGYSKFEVIGNIHDNPELIQEGAAE